MRWLLVALLLSITLSASAQWTSDWTSPSVNYTAASGWLNFQQTGNQWTTRFYEIDSVSFRIMSAAYSPTVQYTYTFSAAERLAGELIYSLGVDLTGDGITEFYVVSNYGSATPYRQGFRIINIVNGSTVFQKDDASNWYGEPTLADLDQDGNYECTFIHYAFPALLNYTNDVYDTHIPATLTEHPGIPQRLTLRQNFPNPFNPSTQISYDIPSGGQIKLDIFNLQGQHVRTLISERQSAGNHTVSWNGTNDNGASQASGPYYYQLRVNGQDFQTKQMLLLR